jgi:hypothetical protein
MRRDGFLATLIVTTAALENRLRALSSFHEKPYQFVRNWNQKKDARRRPFADFKDDLRRIRGKSYRSR